MEVFLRNWYMNDATVGRITRRMPCLLPGGYQGMSYCIPWNDSATCIIHSFSKSREMDVIAFFYVQMYKYIYIDTVQHYPTESSWSWKKQQTSHPVIKWGVVCHQRNRQQCKDHLSSLGFFRSENKRKVLWKSQCWSPYTFSTPLACDATLERGDWGGKLRVREWSILIQKFLPKRKSLKFEWVELRIQNGSKICLSLFNTKDVDWLGRFCFLTTLDDEVLDKWKNQVEGRRHEWKNTRTDELTSTCSSPYRLQVILLVDVYFTIAYQWWFRNLPNF